MYSYSHKYLPPPPKAPRPPNGPPPPRPPSGPSPSSIFREHQNRVNELLPPRGPRPDIPYDDKQRPSNTFFSNTSYATGRATQAVGDFEKRNYGQPNYHDDEICGSGNDGLAGSIQQKLNEGLLLRAINQLERCIKARQETAVDTSHKNLIPILTEFLEQLRPYVTRGIPNKYYYDVLRDGGFVVKFYHRTNPAVFIVSQARNLTYIDENLDETLRKKSRKDGGSKKHKKTYRIYGKHKRRKNTAKKGKKL